LEEIDKFDKFEETQKKT